MPLWASYSNVRPYPACRLARLTTSVLNELLGRDHLTWWLSIGWWVGVHACVHPYPYLSFLATDPKKSWIKKWSGLMKPPPWHLWLVGNPPKGFISLHIPLFQMEKSPNEMKKPWLRHFIFKPRALQQGNISSCFSLGMKTTCWERPSGWEDTLSPLSVI